MAASWSATPIRTRTDPGSCATSYPATEAVPALGLQQRAEDPDHRRLAGTVWTEESVDLPPPNAEVETVDCDRRTETTNQPRGANSCVDGIVLESDLRFTLGCILHRNHSYL